MEESLQQILENHIGFQLNQSKTRIICRITGHELPCNEKALECYIKSKKYRQLTNNGTCDLAKIEEFKEYLIPSKKGRNKLFCLVTKKEINNIPSHIENHVTGRKFQRDLKIYKERTKQAGVSSDERQSCSSNQDDEEQLSGEKAREELDEEMMEENNQNQDEEFHGGIWIPEGTNIAGQDAANEEQMEVENSTRTAAERKSNENVKKGKNKLKRKFKQTKKDNVSKLVNQKKKK